MKVFLSIVLIAVAITVVWLATTADRPAANHEADADESRLHTIRIPHGRVLYVVPDTDGAYLGNQRIEPEHAKATVNALLQKENIRNLMIYGTDLARYGDFVELYAGIDPQLIRWRGFSFYSMPIGSRKPLTGFYKPRCCYADDIENRNPEEE